MADQPGYTRIPNEIIEAMPTLGNAELRVLLAIARKTVGWQKECDVISARQLAALTGLTLRNTHAAIKSLVARGVIGQEPAGKQAFCYRLQTVSLWDTVENCIPIDTGTLGDTVPLPVGIQFNQKALPVGIQQKKDSKENKRKSVGAQKRTPPTRQSSLDSLHEAVAIYKQLTSKSPPPTTATLIATTVVDMDAWRVAVKVWCDRGFKPGNVTGMIDWYLHPDRQQQQNGHRNGTLLRQSINGHSERGVIREADLDDGF